MKKNWVLVIGIILTLSITNGICRADNSNVKDNSQNGVLMAEIGEQAENVIDKLMSSDFNFKEANAIAEAINTRFIKLFASYNASGDISKLDIAAYAWSQFNKEIIEKDDTQAIALAANQITAAMIELAPHIKLPVEIQRMDYLGREIALLIIDKNQSLLLDLRKKELQSLWMKIKAMPQVVSQKQLISDVDKNIGTIEKSANNGEIQKAAADILEQVDKFENLF
jgi:hypothetical protein